MKGAIGEPSVYDSGIRDLGIIMLLGFRSVGVGDLGV